MCLPWLAAYWRWSTASVEQIRKAIEAVDAEMQNLTAKDSKVSGSKERADADSAKLEARKAALIRKLKEAEALHKAAEEAK